MHPIFLVFLAVISAIVRCVYSQQLFSVVFVKMELIFTKETVWLSVLMLLILHLLLALTVLQTVLSVHLQDVRNAYQDWFSAMVNVYLHVLKDSTSW